ncbi:hypothetical protein [Pandoravirus japonicus]|uniref:Uncharacterized protein n=1 Tax=Pandoravirus japonicus TaxID=2823154 RepID=A0A811BMM7_9VIRU|nr:hypothetical protein [Pandoravirus japonicus]
MSGSCAPRKKAKAFQGGRVEKKERKKKHARRRARSAPKNTKARKDKRSKGKKSALHAAAFRPFLGRLTPSAARG